VSTDWQMPRRNESCTACGHAFEIGEDLQAFLYEAPEGYERRDYCNTCSPPDQPQPLGFWRTRRPEPPTKKTQPFDRESIYALFQQLEDAVESEKLRLRFVLALLLWRKKVLKFERSEKRDDSEIWHFRVPRTDDTHSVSRPPLDEDQIERLSAQLEQLLAGGADEATLASVDADREDPDG